jgi:peptide/nickel transport system substrate-binding protein
MRDGDIDTIFAPKDNSPMSINMGGRSEVSRDQDLVAQIENLLGHEITRREALWAFAAATSGLSLTAIVAACSNSSVPASSTRELGQLVISQGVDASNLNPPLTAELTTDNITMNIFDKLVVRDHKTMQPIPQLATAWKPLDEKTWQFSLRKGVKFHNGEDFDAQSVKFTIEWNIDPANKTKQANFIQGVHHVDIIDPYTINIVSTGPNAALPNRLTTVPSGSMLPPKYFQQVGPIKFGQQPIGTSSYKFVEWTKDDHLTLDRFDGYYGNKPAVKRVIFKPIPNEASRVAAIQTGAADIVTALSPDSAKILQGNAGYRAASVASQLVVYMGIPSNGGGPMDDARFRQALNYAVDKGSIVKNTLSNTGKVNPNPFSSECFGYDASVQEYAFDPAKAKSLISAVGAVGHEFVILAPTGRYTSDKEIAQAITQSYTDVGLKPNLQISEWTTYASTKFSSLKNTMFMLGWAGGGSLVPELTMYPLFRSGQPYSVTRDPQLDKILDDLNVAPNANTRKSLLFNSQQMVHDQAYRLYLHQQASIYALGKRIKYEPRVDDAIFVAEVSSA